MSGAGLIGARSAALQSLQMIRGGVDDGLLALSWKAPLEDAPLYTEFFESARMGQAVDLAMAVSSHSHVWACSGLLGARPASGRGKAKDVSSFGHFSLDFDVGTVGHAVAKPRPENKADIYRLLAEGIPEPTTVVDTGNGLLVAWVLKVPLILASEADRQNADKLFKGFQGEICRIARVKFGWDFDATADTVRLVRVAGTSNHKTTPHKPVVMFDDFGPYDPAKSPVLSDAEARSFSNAFYASTKNKADPRSVSSVKVVDTGTKPARDPQLPPIIAGCAFMEHWKDDAATLTEPEWKAGIDVACRCKDSRRQIHEASTPYPGYSVSETDAKIDRAAEGPPPRTCDNIENVIGFTGCALCPYRGKFKSPVALGYVANPIVAALARRWVYVASRDGFIDLHDLETTL